MLRNNLMFSNRVHYNLIEIVSPIRTINIERILLECETYRECCILFLYRQTIILSSNDMKFLDFEFIRKSYVIRMILFISFLFSELIEANILSLLILMCFAFQYKFCLIEFTYREYQTSSDKIAQMNFKEK